MTEKKKTVGNEWLQKNLEFVLMKSKKTKLMHKTKQKYAN